MLAPNPLLVNRAGRPTFFGDGKCRTDGGTNCLFPAGGGRYRCVAADLVRFPAAFIHVRSAKIRFRRRAGVQRASFSQRAPELPSFTFSSENHHSGTPPYKYLIRPLDYTNLIGRANSLLTQFSRSLEPARSRLRLKIDVTNFWKFCSDGPFDSVN